MPETPRTKHPINRDALFMMDRGEAARLAHEALFPLQNLKPHEMVAAVALLFATLAIRTRTSPQDLFEFGRRVLQDQDFHKQTNDSLQSLRDFAGLRIMGEDITFA